MGKNKKETKTNTKQKQTNKKTTNGLVLDSIKPELEKVEENEDMSVNIPVEYVVENNEEKVIDEVTTDETDNKEILEDTLNVEQEQGVYEENETEKINDNQSAQEDVCNEIEEVKDNIENIQENNITKSSSKSNTITTNEMFGYNWMGQIYDY